MDAVRFYSFAEIDFFCFRHAIQNGPQKSMIFAKESVQKWVHEQVWHLKNNTFFQMTVIRPCVLINGKGKKPFFRLDCGP